MIATAIDSEFETKFREEAIVGLFSRVNDQIVFVDFYGSDSRNWGYDGDELVGFMASYSCDATDHTSAVNQTDVDKAFIKVFSDMFASQLDAPHTAMKDCWMKEFIGIAKDFPNNVKTALVKKAEGSNYEKPSDEELTEAQSVAMNLLANCAKSVVMDAYWIASAMTPNVVAFYNQHGRLPMTSEENNWLGCPSDTDKCSGKDWTSVWSNRRGVHLAVGEDLESGIFQTYVFAKPRGGLRSLLFSGDITN